MLRRKNIPTATKENMVTERTTDGAKPATIPKDHNASNTIKSLNNEALGVLENGFNKKVMNNKIKPTCKPETESTCTAPAY